MSKHLILFLLIFATGCGTRLDLSALTPGPAPIRETPPANLPRSLRAWNWTDARGSGSCVHASFVYHLRWQNQLPLADWWKRQHAGGETASSIRRYCDAVGVTYQFTEQADPRFLEWASATRRGAIIWYYPSHCVHFCGFTQDGRYATICDNNRIDQFIYIPRQEFVRNWAGYGGFALTATGINVNGKWTAFGAASQPLVPAYLPRR